VSRDGVGHVGHHDGMSVSAGLVAPRGARRRAVLDVGVAAAGGLLAAALVSGAALHARGGTHLAAGVTDWWLMAVVGGVAFGGCGLWLARTRPRLPVGWLLAAVGIGLATSWAALEYGVRTLPEGGAWTTWSFWYANWSWSACLVTVATVVPLVLPEGALPSRRWRPALALAVLAVAGTSVQWMLTPYGSWSPALAAAGVRNPTATAWAGDPRLGAGLGVVTLGAVVLGLASLVVRWRAAGPAGRQQLGWIALGVAGGVLLFPTGFVVGPVGTALALVPLPAACVVAVLRHGLWDVDVVISRSLVYAALMLLVVALYTAVVAALGGVLGRSTGAPLVATALVAVLALPLHRRLQALVNRLVHGEPEEPLALLARLGDRLGAAQDDATLAERVLPEVVGAVAQGLRLPYVAILLADGTRVEHGTPPAGAGRTESQPLVYGGERVGELVVAPRPGGVRARDRRALADLATQAAVACHAVVLARDVRRSRDAAVAAREEERRRLYRDLHDGLGPSLAALALQVEAARDLMSADPGRARGLLDRAHGRLTTTVAEVRAVVHGLRPAALDDLGLHEALRELAGRFAGGGLDVRVEIRPDAPLTGLPAGVEVAAYAVAAEGLANAARHAGARAVTLRVDAGPDAVVVRVTDDGRGVPPDAAPGLGIVSMRRRAEELGGCFTVGPGPQGRGTGVEARLPLGVR
jgi:signal transduction histidine kinase